MKTVKHVTLRSTQLATKFGMHNIDAAGQFELPDDQAAALVELYGNGFQIIEADKPASEKKAAPAAKAAPVVEKKAAVEAEPAKSQVAPKIKKHGKK